jgi:hypothetical protein
MKAKLTITIDEDVIPRAHRFARARGVSLSSLIEGALRDMTGEQEEPFASRWAGKFEPAAKDDPRYAALARKYL